MSTINRIICKMVQENGGARLVKVPQEKRPTVEGIKKLENEIEAQTSKNAAMRAKSYYMAQKRTRY